MGGKSKSSNNASQKTTSVSANGIAGNNTSYVVDGRDVTINNTLPDNAVDVFKQLVDLTGQALDFAGEAGKAALESNQSAIDKVGDRTQAATQPDLTLAEASIKIVPLMVAGLALVAVFYFTRKK